MPDVRRHQHMSSLYRPAAFAAVGAIIVGLIGLAGFWHETIVQVLLVPVAATLLISGLLGLGRAPLARARQLFVWTFAIAVLLGLSLPAGHLAHHVHLAAARRYCESFLPSLQVRRVSDGTYPLALSLPHRPLPRFISFPFRRQGVSLSSLPSKSAAFYACAPDRQSFRFFVSDPTNESGIWVYRSGTQRWAWESHSS